MPEAAYLNILQISSMLLLLQLFSLGEQEKTSMVLNCALTGLQKNLSPVKLVVPKKNTKLLSKAKVEVTSRDSI